MLETETVGEVWTEELAALRVLRLGRELPAVTLDGSDEVVVGDEMATTLGAAPAVVIDDPAMVIDAAGVVTVISGARGGTTDSVMVGMTTICCTGGVEAGFGLIVAVKLLG